MHDDTVMPSTPDAVWYCAKLMLGTRLVAAGRRIMGFAETAEAIAVGVGWRVAETGSRLADAPGQLIEPQHPVARRAARLPALSRMTCGSLGLCSPAQPPGSFRWLHGGQG